MLIKERDEFIKRSLKIFDDYFGRCYSSNDITNDHIVRKYIVSYDEIERFREKYPYGVGMPLKVKYGTREFDDNRKVQRRILNSRMDRAFNSNKLEIQKLTSILNMNVEVIELYEQKDREHNLTCDDIKMLSEKNMWWNIL